MIIHGAVPSPFARKVMVACEEKGISYESQDLIPFPKSPELLAMNPIGKIPVLEVSEGVYLPDSSVICAYLERVHPEPTLFPGDAVAFGKALFIEEYCDTKLNDAVTPILFQRFIKPVVFKEETDEKVVAEKLEELAGVLDQIESLVPDHAGPLLEAGFGLGDIAFGAQLGSLKLARFDVDAARWPKVRAYSEWVLARPSFEKVHSELS
ncbi:MAG: glutathione S-transferase family protein [Deltaproteobacteria bacterium]|nr:glutathione S-transferase family protein [Deltaproteobacteria bacterium]